MLWDLYQQYRIGQIGRQLDDVRESAAALEGSSDLRAAARLDEKVNRLALICRAMFELMQASSGVTEDQLKAKIVEIDLRDGQADGKMTERAKPCPKCGATMSPQMGRCLFCGHQDDVGVGLPVIAAQPARFVRVVALICRSNPFGVVV